MTRAQTTYSDVRAFSNPSSGPAVVGDPVDGASTLIRNETGVAYTMSTRGLRKKWPYTNWLVVFNNPKICKVQCECGVGDLRDALSNNTKLEIGVFWATGRVADEYGQAVFTATANYPVDEDGDGLPENDELPDGEDQVPFYGLDSPVQSKDAEIHIVTRAHGKAKEKRKKLEEQLTQFNGGCPATGAPRCKDVQISIHPSPTCVPDQGPPEG